MLDEYGCVTRTAPAVVVTCDQQQIRATTQPQKLTNMPPQEVRPEDPVEIEDKEQYDLITSNKSKDINVIDVYAEWCGPCRCLLQTYKRILFDNDAVIGAALEEGKTVKYWMICAGESCHRPKILCLGWLNAVKTQRLWWLENHASKLRAQQPPLLLFITGD